MTVVQAAGHKLPSVGNEIDLVAVGRLPDDAMDRAIQDPGMATEKRPDLAAFEHDLGAHAGNR